MQWKLSQTKEFRIICHLCLRPLAISTDIEPSPKIFSLILQMLGFGRNFFFQSNLSTQAKSFLPPKEVKQGQQNVGKQVVLCLIFQVSLSCDYFRCFRLRGNNNSTEIQLNEMRVFLLFRFFFCEFLFPSFHLYFLLLIFIFLQCQQCNNSWNILQRL